MFFLPYLYQKSEIGILADLKLGYLGSMSGFLYIY